MSDSNDVILKTLLELKESSGEANGKIESIHNRMDQFFDIVKSHDEVLGKLEAAEARRTGRTALLASIFGFGSSFILEKLGKLLQ